MDKTLILAFILNAFNSIAQNEIIDSLQLILSAYDAEKLEMGRDQGHDQADSVKVKTLNNLGWQFMVISDYAAAKKCLDEALAIAQQIGFKKGIAKTYNSIGVNNWYQGYYPEALKNHFASLKIKEEMGDSSGASSSYNNIGMIYKDLGNYPEALKYHFASLKIDESTGDKLGVAASYNNIGVIYKVQRNYHEAIKNQMAALQIRKTLGDKPGMADSYNNLGNIYLDQGNYNEALSNHFNSLRILEEIGDRNGVATSYSNIGNAYFDQQDYPEALRNQFAALKIFEEIGYKSGIASSCISIGSTKSKMHAAKDGKAWLLKGLEAATEIGAMPLMQDGYEAMANAESTLGNFRDAYENYKLFVLYRDNLNSEETNKKLVQTRMQYEFDKKEAETRAATDLEIKKQKLVRNSFMGGFAIMLLFAVVIFWQRNKIKREKQRAEDETRRAEEEKRGSEALLLNILPREVADEIKKTGKVRTKAFPMVTVMFADFKNFTRLSEMISAERLVEELNTCFSAFDFILRNYKIEKIKTIGDAYLCAGGLPVSNDTHASDVLSAALEIRSFILDRKLEKEANGETPFELRIGIHTGPVVAGVVGIRKYAYDIWGDTVNTAARIEQNSETGKINISGATHDLVKDKFNCTYRGKIKAKNKGEIDMYFVECSA